MDLNLTNSQTPIVVSSNTTALNDRNYTVVANATFTDPTPVEGKGFKVFVRNGTAVIGGTSYTVGSEIIRIFHSGSWANYRLDATSNAWRYINSSDSSAITGTTINTIIRAVHIPANTLTSNSVLRILQNEYDKTGTNNTSVRIYINTSNSLVGASLLANRLNYTGLYFQLRRNLKCDGTNLKGYNSGANIAVESELSVSTTSRTPVDVSVDNWLIFAVQLSNTSDSIIQTGLDIEICTQ